jgi:hypothetical protein
MPVFTIPWVHRLCCPCYQHIHMKPEMSVNWSSFIEPSYRVAVSAGTFCSLNPCVGSISVCRNPFVYEQLFSEFLLIFFGTIFPSTSFDLTSFRESSQMRITPWHPIAVCAVAGASQCCHFSQCFVVKFCINHFQCLHLKKLILYYILCMISPKLFEFSTQL